MGDTRFGVIGQHDRITAQGIVRHWDKVAFAQDVKSAIAEKYPEYAPDVILDSNCGDWRLGSVSIVSSILETNPG